MNQNTPLWGAVRTFVAAGLAYAAGKGWMPGDAGGEIAAAVTTILVTVWSGFSKPKAD